MATYKVDTVCTNALANDTDPTKKLKISLTNISPNTTRILTMPDADITVVGIDNNQILTNKNIQGNTNIIDADNLKTTGTAVSIAGSEPPSSGDVLTATSSTIASWKSIPKIYFNTGDSSILQDASTIKQWYGKSASLNGIALFHATLDGTATGTPIFTNLTDAYMFATGQKSTTNNIDVPFCSIKDIINSGKSVQVNVRCGNNGGILVGGTYTGIRNADDGTAVYLYIIGT